MTTAIHLNDSPSPQRPRVDPNFFEDHQRYRKTEGGENGSRIVTKEWISHVDCQTLAVSELQGYCSYWVTSRIFILSVSGNASLTSCTRNKKSFAEDCTRQESEISMFVIVGSSWAKEVSVLSSECDLIAQTSSTDSTRITFRSSIHGFVNAMRASWRKSVLWLLTWYWVWRVRLVILGASETTERSSEDG